ncbi:MAG: rRNA maturation RNase YbeY [Patescibacteria group bacterium]|nr:rRNA maturation RNase YbeY [Patescibacteria group bacterium]
MLEIHNFTQNEIDEKFLKRITVKTLKSSVVKRTMPDLLKGEVEISLAIVGEGRMRKLNKIYRGKNKVTDILSFGDKTVLPYLAKAFPRLKKGANMAFVNPPDGIKRLGEIVICYPYAKKQARRMGHSLEKEMTILLIHGILHLLGYDHEKNERQAKEMEGMEVEILRNIEHKL